MKIDYTNKKNSASLKGKPALYFSSAHLQKYTNIFWGNKEKVNHRNGEKKHSRTTIHTFKRIEKLLNGFCAKSSDWIKGKSLQRTRVGQSWVESDYTLLVLNNNLKLMQVLQKIQSKKENKRNTHFVSS